MIIIRQFLLFVKYNFIWSIYNYFKDLHNFIDFCDNYGVIVNIIGHQTQKIRVLRDNPAIQTKDDK